MKKNLRAMQAHLWSREAEARKVVQNGKLAMRYNYFNWVIGNVIGLVYDRTTENYSTWIYPVANLGEDEIDFQKRVMIRVISDTDNLDLIGLYWKPDNRKLSPQALSRKLKRGSKRISGNRTIF